MRAFLRRTYFCILAVGLVTASSSETQLRQKRRSGEAVIAPAPPQRPVVKPLGARTHARLKVCLTDSSALLSPKNNTWNNRQCFLAGLG